MATAACGSSNTFVSSNFSMSSATVSNPQDHPHAVELAQDVDSTTIDIDNLNCDAKTPVNLCSNCEKALAGGGGKKSSNSSSRKPVKLKQKTTKEAKEEEEEEEDPEKISTDKAKKVTEIESFEGVELNPPPKGNLSNIWYDTVLYYRATQLIQRPLSYSNGNMSKNGQNNT